MSANANEIKIRIRAINSVGRISDMMRLSSSSKMRLIKQRVDHNYDVMSQILKAMPEAQELKMPVVEEHRSEKVIIAIGPDRGLCGGLSTFFVQNLIKTIDEESKNLEVPKVITLGRRISQSFCKINKMPNDEFEQNDTEQILADKSGLLMSSWMSRIISATSGSKSFIYYADFKHFGNWRWNMVDMQTPSDAIRSLLSDKVELSNTLHEISSLDANSITIMAKRSLIAHAILRGYYAELTARAIAMDEAVKNASKLANDLWRKYNSIRQNVITNNILEVISSIESQ